MDNLESHLLREYKNSQFYQDIRFGLYERVDREVVILFLNRELSLIIKSSQ